MSFQLAAKMQRTMLMRKVLQSAVVLLLLSVSTACSLNKPVPGTGERSTATDGTLAGLISTDGGKTPVSGRKVTATNTATNAPFDTTSATDGGYTLRLPAGRYAIDVELRAGERLEKRPEPTDVGAGDLDAGRDFVITR
jgi:hypothetical protein